LQLTIEKGVYLIIQNWGLDYKKKGGGEVKKLTTLIIICGILIAAPVYKANLISESATMVLLGVGLIVLSAIGRKKV
jgi:hypothetical protein